MYSVVFVKCSKVKINLDPYHQMGSQGVGYEGLAVSFTIRLGSLEDGWRFTGDFNFQLVYPSLSSVQNDRSLQAFVRRPRRRTPSNELQRLSFPAVQPSNLSNPGELRVQWSSTSWKKMIATLPPASCDDSMLPSIIPALWQKDPKSEE